MEERHRPGSIKAQLAEHDLRPSKGLGQHFLTDPVALERIVAAAELSERDWVLEIGPGLGHLTRKLVERAGQVVAVELDPAMVAALTEELGDRPNLRVVQGDILKLDVTELMEGHPFKVVANLPYYITSAVLRRLLEAALRPALIVVTVQREVAQRIVAGPGEMSLLAVSVQFYGRPRIVARIPAGAFYPPPKVESAVVRIDLYPQPPLEVEDVDSFFRVVQAGFGQRRKQLKNALAHGLGCPVDAVAAALKRAGVDPRRRAETLSVEEWGAVYQALETLRVSENP